MNKNKSASGGPRLQTVVVLEYNPGYDFYIYIFLRRQSLYMIFFRIQTDRSRCVKLSKSQIRLRGKTRIRYGLPTGKKRRGCGKRELLRPGVILDL